MHDSTYPLALTVATRAVHIQIFHLFYDLYVFSKNPLTGPSTQPDDILKTSIRNFDRLFEL